MGVTVPTNGLVFNIALVEPVESDPEPVTSLLQNRRALHRRWWRRSALGYARAVHYEDDTHYFSNCQKIVVTRDDADMNDEMGSIFTFTPRDSDGKIEFHKSRRMWDQEHDDGDVVDIPEIKQFSCTVKTHQSWGKMKRDGCHFRKTHCEGIAVDADNIQYIVKGHIGHLSDRKREKYEERQEKCEVVEADPAPEPPAEPTVPETEEEVVVELPEDEMNDETDEVEETVLTEALL